MVGRHTSFLVTKRSLRNSDSSTGKRPRRLIQTKNVDDTVGLSRREEQELNKALYASLQENRRSKVLPGFGGDSISSFTSSNNFSSCSSSSTSIGKGSIKSSRCLQETSSTATTTSISSSCGGGSRVNKSQKVLQALKHSVLSGRVSPKRLSRHRDLTASLSLDESSQDSVRSSASSHNGSKRKVHAQRKFAQGCSLPGMTSCTPVKFTTPAVKMLSSRVPKTEDFLTFLCLRGSSILPSHLDFFNFSLEEPPSCQEGTKPASYTEKKLREGASDSSSTSSGANDEVAETASITTPTMTSRSGGASLARRSAARASAGTPETARGIVSLRQGLQRKVSTSSSSSSLTRFPVSSSCLLPASQLTNNPPCQYRNKFYFTPEKSPSPSKTSGIRPGEFTPPSLFSSTSHMSSTYKFSPLVCSPSKFASIEQPFGSPASQSTSSRSSSLSSTSLCGASKRKRRTTVPPRTASTKVTCNSGSSIPSFRMPKCTRLDGLVCLSSLAPNSVSSSPVASLASSPTSTPITPSSRSPVNSSQTGNQDCTSNHPCSTSLTPTSTNFTTINCIHPASRNNKINPLEPASPYLQPMRTFSKFKHTGHKFPLWRNLKNGRTQLSTQRNCKFRSASYLKYSWKKAFRARSVFTDSSYQSCPNSNTAHSNHVPAPSVSACSSNFDHCCNLHECSRSNPESLHACPTPNSKSCMFGCQHVRNESTVQPGVCSSDWCHLQCQNNIEVTREVTSGDKNSYTSDSVVNTCPDNDSGSCELQDDTLLAHIVSDFDAGRTFSRDVSDVDVHKKCYRSVSDVKRRCRSDASGPDVSRTCRSSDSESDSSRKGDKRVFDFHVDSTFYRGVSDIDGNRTFHKDVSDFGVNRTSHKGVSDVDNDRTFHKGVSDVDNDRTFHKGVSDHHVNRTFRNHVSDVNSNRTFHRGVLDDVNRTFHKGVSDDDNNRTFHKGVSDDDNNRTFHKGVSDVDNNRTFHKGVSDVDNNRTFHKGVSDVDNNRTFHKGVSDVDNNRTFHKGVSDVDNNRTFHKGVSDVDNNRTFHKGVSDVDNNRTSHKGVSDDDISRTFHRHIFGVDRMFHQNVDSTDSAKKCRSEDSDRMISNIGCDDDDDDDDDDTGQHSGVAYKVTSIFDSDRENGEFYNEYPSQNNEEISFSGVSRRKHSQHAENTTNSSFLSFRRKTKKNHYKYRGKHRSKRRLNERRKKNVERKYRLVKEVPKVKIRIVRKHSVNKCTLTSNVIERHCHFQESAGELDKKPSGADFQKEFLKMLQADGMPHLPDGSEAAGNIGCRTNVTWSVSGARHEQDLGRRTWRNISDDTSRQQYPAVEYVCDSGCVRKDSESYSENCSDFVQPMNHIDRDVSVKLIGHNQKSNICNADELLTGFHERCLNELGKNHSKCIDRQRKDSGLVDYQKNHKESGDYQRNHIKHGDYQENHIKHGNYQRNHIKHGDYQENHQECGNYQRNHIKHGDYQENHIKHGNNQRNHIKHRDYQENHKEYGDYQRNHIKHGDYQENHQESGDYKRNHIKHGDYQENHKESGDHQRNHIKHGDYEENHKESGDYQRNHIKHGDYQENYKESGDYLKNHSECGDGDDQRNHSEYGVYQRNHSVYADYQQNHIRIEDYPKSHNRHLGSRRNHTGCGDYQRNPKDQESDRRNHGKDVNCLRSHGNGVNHSESDYHRIQSGLASNRPGHETMSELSTQDETLSVNSHKEYQQLSPDSLHDSRWSITAGSKKEVMSNVSAKPTKEPTNLADSITLRDKVISAFAKFNRKDIIASSFEVAHASSEQPESTVMLETNYGADAGDKLSGSQPTYKASAVNSPATPSECCCIDDVCQCGPAKLSPEAIVSDIKEDSVGKTDSGGKLLEDVSRRHMLDESIVEDKELDRLSCHTDSSRLDLSATCSLAEANGEIIPDTTGERNSFKGEFQLSEMSTSEALDLRKCCLVKQLPVYLKVSTEQNNPEYNRAAQTEALDLSESGKSSSVSTNCNPSVSQENGDEIASTLEDCSPTEDDAVCSCLTKDLQSCNRQCMVHSHEQNQTQTRAEVVDKQIGTDPPTCGRQQVVTTDIEASHSGCKLNHYECNTKSENTLGSNKRISPLFRHKTAVHLTHGGKKQFKIKMIDVGRHAVKEYEIQQNSANCKCHIYESRKDNISAKHSAIKQSANTEQQSLKSHLVISDHIAAQQEQPISSCVSISIQTDSGCNEPKEQNLASRNENTELEVELGSNQRSVKVQVSNCDSNFIDASLRQGQYASSEEMDSRAFDNVITVEMSHSPQNDKKSQYGTHPCCPNSQGIISSKQSHTTRHCCINSQSRGFSSESQGNQSASETTNLLHKEKTNTDQDHVDGAMIWSSDPRTDNTESNKKTFLSDTSPRCSHVSPSNQSCSSQAQKTINRICKGALFAKEETSRGHRSCELLEQLDCYISGITYFNDGVEKYDPEEPTIQDESDDVIMLSDDLKDEITSDDITNSSVSPVTNAVSDLVIDLSVHSRSDSSCSRSSSDSRSSWSNCSNSSSGSSDNCSISFCDDRIAGACSIGFPVADVLDLTETNGNTTVTSNRQSVFETVVHKESTATGLLDLRKITTENFVRDFISGTDLTPSSGEVNQNESAEKTKSILPLVCTYSKQKLGSSVYGSEHQNDRLNSDSTRRASQHLEHNKQDRNKHPNSNAELKCFQKQSTEYNSLNQRQTSSSHHPVGENTAGDNTFMSHLYSEINVNKERTDKLDLVGTQNQGHGSSRCCRGVSEIQGEELSSENSIILHSYGSLNTGEGFTVVDGKLKQCEILNKQHLRSNSTKCSNESCMSSHRHSVVKGLGSTAMKRSAAFSTGVSRSACGSVKTRDERNDGPRKQQNNDAHRLEQLPNQTSLSDEIGNSSNKQGGVKRYQRDLGFHPPNNIRNDISGFDNHVTSSGSGTLEAAGNVECFDLSQQLEQVQISNCNNQCHAVSKGYMQALKQHATRSDVSQVVIRPKYKRKVSTNVSRNHKGISNRKPPQGELPRLSNKIFASQKENTASLQQHPKMTQVINAPRGFSSVAQPLLSNSLGTARFVLNRNRQIVPKSCPSLCMISSQTKSFPESVSDRSILRSAYISDLERLKGEVSPKSSHRSAYFYTSSPCSSQPNARVGLYNPDSIFISKVGGKTAGAHRKNDSSRENYTVSSKSALSGADGRQVRDTSLHVLNNGVTTSSSYVHTNILGHHSHAKQIRETAVSADRGCTRNQALLHSQHGTESLNSQAPVIPANAAPASASSSGFSHVDHSPINLSRSGKAQECYPGDWAVEIPCSMSPASYLTNSQEENVLDVIMEELKTQIALLKEEIMRESQQQSEDPASKSRGRKNKGLSKVSLRPRGQRGFLLSQRRKSYRYGLQQLDHLFDFSKGNLSRAAGTCRSRDNIGQDLNGLSYTARLPEDETTISGHSVYRQNGNYSTSSGILMLDSTPKLTSGLDQLTGHCSRKISEDKMLRSTDAVFGRVNGGLTSLSVQTFEASNINLTMVAEDEKKDYIEVSSDDEYLPVSL